MENCLYSGLTLVGLFNHQSEKSVQTEPSFLETYFVKDFFDPANKPNLCFERFNVKGDALNITKNDRAMIEDFIQKNDTNCNSLEFAHFEEQFIKAHFGNFKPSEQGISGNGVPHPLPKDFKLDNKTKPITGNAKFVKVDLKERRYKCETCNKRFVNSSDFKRHLKIHTDEKLFVCNICNKG